MPRSPLVQLRHILRVSRSGDGLLSGFVADHAEDIAAALGTNTAALAALDLDAPEVRGRLTAAVTRATNQEAATRLVEADRRRHTRGRSLASAARWKGNVIELPLPELFALASSAIAPVLRLETPDFGVHLDRALLARTRAVLARLPSPTAHLDAAALHLRWRGERGGLDLRCNPPAPRDQPAFVVRLEPRVARQPVLLAEVLHDLGLTA